MSTIKSQKIHTAKTLRLAFAIFMILTTLVVGVVAINQNTESRSKAAEEQVIYKQWEFNGKEFEGWTVNKPHILDILRGKLQLRLETSDNVLAVKNSTVQTDLPNGNKFISFNLAVGSTILGDSPTPSSCPAPPICVGSQLYKYAEKSLRGRCPAYKCIPIQSHTPFLFPTRGNSGYGWVKGAQNEILNEDASFEAGISNRVACSQEAKICPDGSTVGRSGSSCAFLPCPVGSTRRFSGKVYYSLKKSATEPAVMQKPLEFSGIADGKQQEIKLKFPEIGKASIRTIRIQFTSGMKGTDTILIDWIRIFGIKTVTNTPTAQPTCIPRPACMDPVDGGPVCKIALPEGGVFCPKTPTPTQSITDSSCIHARNGSPCTSDTLCPTPTACATGAKCIQNRMACINTGTCQDGQCIVGKKVVPPGCYYQQVQCIKAPCDPILVCPTPISEEPPVTSDGCVRAGCSGQLCVQAGSEARMGITTCEFRESYACYASARCEKQASGACGWTQTGSLQNCLASSPRY